MMDKRLEKLPIATEIESETRLSLTKRMVKWLTPDTRMKRWTFAGLFLALVFDEDSFFYTLSVPILIVSGLYYSWQIFKLVRERLLWKVRDRILVSFVFVGVVPITIVLLIGLIVSWFLIGTLGASLLEKHVENTVSRMERLPQAVQVELYRNASKNLLPLSEIVNTVLESNRNLPGLTLEIYEQRQNTFELLYAHPDTHPGVQTPAWIQKGPFAGVMLDTLSDNALPDSSMLIDFRSGSMIDVNDRKFYVLACMPLSKPFQTEVWNESGVFIASQFLSRRRPIQRFKDEVDWSELPLGLGEFRLPWAGALKAHEWHNNESKEVFLTIWLDPLRILNDTMDTKQRIVRILFATLIGLCLGLACVEVGSFLLGLVISRRITTAVYELSEGTQALRTGQLDFKINTGKRDQLGELGQSFNAMTGSIQVLLKEVGEKERIEAELGLAREVQARFIPTIPPDMGRLELAGNWIPARMVSGDYYDFIEHQERVLDIVVSDISGKGMSAALMMAGLRSALRSQSVVEARDLKPGRLSSLVSRLNLHLCHNSAPEKFATLFICAFDPNALTLAYCCAGHNPPLLVRDGKISVLDVGGCPIGLFTEWKFQEDTIPVIKGDLIVIYTDGITEAQSANQNEFGEERLQQVVLANQNRSCEEIQEKILRAVRDFSIGAEQFDDQTIVVGRVK